MYIYGVPYSRVLEAKLWAALWKPPRNTCEHKVKTLVLPITVHDICWYLAIAHVTQAKCIMDIRNNLSMQSKEVEERLKRIGSEY